MFIHEFFNLQFRSIDGAVKVFPYRSAPTDH
jgi:hypothetical protein